MAEQIAFQHLLAQPGAVQFHEGVAFSRSVVVDPARQRALAHTGFTLDEHRAVEHDHARDLFLESLHGCAGAEKRADGEADFPVLFGQVSLPLLHALEDAVEHHRQGGWVHGFAQELLGAEANRLRGPMDELRVQEKQDGHFVIHIPKATDELQCPAIAKIPVQEHHVRAVQREGLFRRHQAIHLNGFISLSPNQACVQVLLPTFDDQDFPHSHAVSRCS